MIQAYRNSPINPAHKKYMAICWQDNIYMQHKSTCSTMPLKALHSEARIQGAPTDTCIKILCMHKISPVFKRVDDFVIFRSLSTFSSPH